MNDDLRRLKRAVVFLTMALLVVAGALAFWISAKIGQSGRDIALIRSELQTVQEPIDLKGLQVKNGIDGKDGRDGVNGQNALSTHTTTIVKEPTTTIIQQNIPVPGPIGEQGAQGDIGPAGREIELGITLSGLPMWRYAGDEEWRKPLEVQQ